jgi:glucose/arabinose dehydrogenase
MKKLLITFAIIIFGALLVILLFPKPTTAPTPIPPLIPPATPTFLSKSPLPPLTPHEITLKSIGKFSLSIPEDYTIHVAAEGYQQLRFMAKSPDNRLFVTEMFTRNDTSKGKLYIFENFNQETKKFDNVTTYLSNLRNPNSVAFYTDKTKPTWLYLALTDKLVRFKYTPGDNAPKDPPQILATFPDYGLNYKYGGWHLTRTVAIHNDKVYVAVGSSCNSCEEKEAVRASIVEMNLDGTNQKNYASGLRNSVGIEFVGDQLFVTGMGSDHLGNDKPEDTFYAIQPGVNYGWPYCYQYQNKMYDDTSQDWIHKTLDCQSVPLAWNSFIAHSAPLGLRYFPTDFKDENVNGSFLVALHGAGDISLDHGNKIVRVQKDAPPEDFITGFWKKGKRYGRVVDIVPEGDKGFFFTDDLNGVVYYVEKK